MTKIDKRNVFDVYPLTAVQQGILFESCKDVSGKMYGIRIFIGYDTALNDERFKAAWHSILQEHTLLRSVIRWRKISKPVQVILKDTPERVAVIKRDGISFTGFEDYIKVFCTEATDIERGTFAVTLHHINDQKSLIELRSHHIIQDGWSTSILLHEFVTRYASTTAVNHTRPSFKEYISFLSGHYDNLAARQFWSSYLENAEFGLLANAQAGDNLEPVDQVRVFDSDFCVLLQKRASDHHLSVSSILHLGWSLAIRNYLGTDDVIFGSVVSGRPSALKGIEGMVGNFVNTIPFRMIFDPKLLVKEALQQVHQTISARSEYELHTTAQIKSFAGIESHTDLFDSVLVVENYPFDNRILQDPALRPAYSNIQESSNYAIDISVRMTHEVEVHVKYQTAKICEPDMTVLFNSFKNALDFILKSSDKPVTSFRSITKEDEHRILYEFNQPVQPRSLPEESLIELFERQVRMRPASLAIVSDKSSLTYGQLYDAVNRLASKLKHKGVAQGEVYGLYASHSSERIVAMLAIVKAGGVFMPLRQNESLEVLQNTLRRCSVRKVLVENRYLEDFYRSESFEGTMIIGTDTNTTDPIIECDCPTVRSGAVYALLTSGSTGSPKAVLIEHTGLLNTVQWFIRNFEIDHTTNILQLTDYTFDPAFEDIFGGLLAGATIHLPTPEILSDPGACYRYMQRAKIHIINYVPSVLYEILGRREKIPSLNIVISGGEALSEAIKNDLLHTGYDLYNNYGPTEVTVDCLSAKCDMDSVHLGKPVANSYCLILDRDSQLVPIHQTGEICIGGLGVARGYLNNAELTAEKFVEDPYHPGKILYKTGDYGKWQDNGTVLYMGRRDSQIKINGVRIELNAVKDELNKLDFIVQSEVVAGPAKGLVAFVRCEDNSGLSEDIIRSQLRKLLPQPMVPGTIRIVDKFPLTGNGKTDIPELMRTYHAPIRHSGPTNAGITYGGIAALANIWSEVLQVSDPDPDLSFFELGGDSFGIMKCVNRINEHYNLDIPVSTFFSYPSLRLLGNHIQNLQDKRDDSGEEINERVSKAKGRLLSIRKNR